MLGISPEQVTEPQLGLALCLAGKGAGSQSTPCYACSCAKLKSLAGVQIFKVLGMGSLINAKQVKIVWDVFKSNSFFHSSSFNCIVTG